MLAALSLSLALPADAAWGASVEMERSALTDDAGAVGAPTDGQAAGERIVLKAWKRPLVQALRRDQRNWGVAWAIGGGLSAGVIGVGLGSGWGPGDLVGLWVAAPGGGVALAMSSLGAGSALAAADSGLRLLERAESPEALRAELRAEALRWAVPGYILMGVTLTTGLVGLASWGIPLFVSSGVTAIVGTPFLHAGTAYFLQARRTAFGSGHRPTPIVSLSPVGIVVRF